MILKIEINEEHGTGLRSHLEANFINKNIVYEHNGQSQGGAKTFDREKLEFLIARSIRDWKSEYIDNTVICGKTVQMLVITDKEVRTHVFKNSFPENYDDFIRALKKELQIL